MMTIEAIRQLLGAELLGKCVLHIGGAEHIDRAQPNQITFIGDRHHLRKWPQSKAGAAIISRSLAKGEAPGAERAFLIVEKADLAMAQLLEAFAPPLPAFEPSIHPTAIIHPTARLGKDVEIGAYCFVGKGVILGNGVRLYHQVCIYDDCQLGDHTTVWSGTVIREHSQIGEACILHTNVSIGADGFGFRPAPDGRGVVKIPHIGHVRIGHKVEIGANSCVDRGKFSATSIGDGTKIDNLVQIAHNVVIGRSCLIAANVGIAGSTVLGDGVMIGGGASIKDHITIGSGAIIAAGAGVIGDVAPGKRMLGSPAGEYREKLKEWVHLQRIVKEQS